MGRILGCGWALSWWVLGIGGLSRGEDSWVLVGSLVEWLVESVVANPGRMYNWKLHNNTGQ